MLMDRLIDYFAVVGYDFEAEGKDPALRGRVLFRVPEDDIKEVPFTSGIELFCQPGGWYLAKEKQQPTFFVSILTDAEGKQQFCAVHTFHEPLRPTSPTDTARFHSNRSNSVISIRRVKSENDMIENGVINFDSVVGDEFIDEDMCRVEGGDTNGVLDSLSDDKTSRNSKYSYAPKCLVLLSRVHDFRILKNCLGLIYTVYIENLSQSIENLLAKLLLVKAPPPGSTVVRFSIGAADKQALQTPQSDQLPVTRSSVTVLLRQLGILNVLNVLSAALIDQKILFYSCSYARLTEACNALTALMYPFKYSYPFIPILPRHLLECTSSPTPFLFGVHSSFKNELQDLLDVVTVDLDGGVISVPECVIIPSIPEPYYTSAVEALTKVLCPDLVVADWAYPPEQIRTSEPARLDKEIRAIFIRLFCQILMGYRSCLQVCRIHPKPIIRFQKEHYLNMRGFDVSNTSSSNQFVPKLLESQAFALFVQDNGPPFRRLHIFDEVVSEIPERIQFDMLNVLLALKHIKLIASDLYVNENPNHLPLSERIPKPSEGSFTRSNQRKFPMLSVNAVNMFMEENKLMIERERIPKITKQSRKRVPKGTTPNSFMYRVTGTATSSRRLEVLKNCLSFIFESKTLEIKKIFQAVIRAMRSRGVRSALVQELYPYSKSHAFLDNQQFDYISRLLNRALMDSSGQLDEYTLAADLLPIITNFCRKLTSTVTQFLYTVVQEHPVWSSSAFWESAFFDDIQMEIQHLYRDCLKQDRQTVAKRKLQASRNNRLSLNLTAANSEMKETSLAEMEANPHWRDNQLCMDIAAIQLKKWFNMTDQEQEEVSSAEEGVVFSQAMLNAQKMVFMLVPLDSSRINRSKFLRPAPGEDHSSNSYYSLQGSLSGSIGEESGYDEGQEGSNDISASVTKFICRFIDRVCTEACINNDHTKALLDKIQQLVHMQVESLIDVCRESKRIAPVTKPKLLLPQLLKGESMALENPYRAFLTYDGRATATGGEIGGPALLPAEGALFVTTYRVIFIGIPRDALASEQVVIRSFPVSSLFKVKSINTHDFPQIVEISKNLQHGIQLSSSSFQLLLLAFDEEVTMEEIEQLQKELHDLRYPDTIEGAFALSSSLYATSSNATNTVIRSRSAAAWDNKTLTNAKATTLFLQAKRKVGFDKNSKKPLYSSSFAGSTAGSTLKPPQLVESQLSVPQEENSKFAANDRSYESDYARIGLIGFAESKFRTTPINKIFGICKSYPTNTVIPVSVTDDQVRALSHCHQNGRYPVVVWKHPTHNSMLLRASAMRTRTIGLLFKYGPNKLSDDGGSGFTSVEEKFFLLLASMTTPSDRPISPTSRLDSVSSQNSVDDENHSSAFARGGLISSSIRVQRMRKWTFSTRPNGKVHTEQTSEKASAMRAVSAASSGSGGLAQAALHNAMSHHARLYVFVDKDQLKNLRTDQQGRVTFVPVEYPGPKDIRASFKALLKSCLPVEAPPPPDSSSNQQQAKENIAPYLKDVQESSWMEQVSQLLETSGCIVDVIDVHGGSAMLAIEDGMDAVPQLSSLTQLLLDPHYRTIVGFQVLVEKEWLSFGHRFGHRNRFNDIQSSGFTPIFLMFLDAVFQVHRQFPLSFEFNEFYLELLAYHYMSNRFTTFLLDCDYERLEAGILTDEKRSEFSEASESSNSQLKSFWGYVEAAHKRSPVFYNPLYSPKLLTTKVLRPVSSVYALKIWPYYVREALGEGPPYDGLMGELAACSSHNEQEATETSEAWGGATGRRLVNRCYDNIAEVQPDSVKILLTKIEGLQRDLGMSVDDWSTSLNDAIDTTPSHEVQLPDASLKARNDVLTLHKQSTADFLNKRQSTARRSRRNSEKSSILEEVVVSGGSRRNSLDDENGSASSLEEDCFFTSNTDEVRTYEGALWKQGALIKGWKLRFFVLDTTKHELRQHDNEGSNLSKTIIDLKDLESVRKLDSLSGVPKDASDKACFEVKTSRRVYNFIAQSEQAAAQWVDQLEATLQ